MTNATRLAGAARRLGILGAVGAIPLAVDALPAQTAVPRAEPEPAVTLAGTVKLALGTTLEVESRDDGWVVVRVVPNQRNPRHVEARVFLARDAVIPWALAARTALNVGSDVTPESWRVLDVLGAGSPNQIVPSMASGAPTLRLRSCGTDGPEVGARGEVEQLLWALERAALVSQGPPKPVRPTLARPYVASAVTCSVVRANADVPMAAPPNAEPEVAVRYVVDTSGTVEAGSVVVLPGTSSAGAAAARARVLGRRYQAALVGDVPVRQVVHAVVPLAARTQEDEELSRSAEQPHQRLTVRADSSGWVHVRDVVAYPHATYVRQEWFTPTQIDSFVRRIPRWLDSLRIPHERRGWLPPPRLGSLNGMFQAINEGAEDVAPRHGLSWAGCQPFQPSEFRDGVAYLELLAAAAAQARAIRAEPLPPAPRAHGSDEVACQAHRAGPLPRRPGEPAPRRYASVPATPAVTAGRVRDEVFVSVVVDSVGLPDVRTARVMPGADARAVDAVMRALPSQRWIPATRGGARVAQRVMESFVVAPAPRCGTAARGECPREYRTR